MKPQWDLNKFTADGVKEYKDILPEPQQSNVLPGERHENKQMRQIGPVPNSIGVTELIVN